MAAEPKPAGKVGKADFGQAGKAGLSYAASEAALQLAEEISRDAAAEISAYPFLTRMTLAIAIRLSIAVIEERGSLTAGLKFFAAYARARWIALKQRKRIR